MKNQVPDGLMPLVEAVQKATGRRPALTTVIRWATHPKRGVSLRIWCVGSRKLTTVEAVNEYVSQLTDATLAPSQPTCTRTPRQRERAMAQADADLANIAKSTRKQTAAAR